MGDPLVKVGVDAMTPFYRGLAQIVDAYYRSEVSEWRMRHRNTIDKLVREIMPSGSGIDNGTQIDLAESTGERLVFTTAFHHMNDVGMYDGWTEHKVIVKPSLMYGFDVRITGRNRNDVKAYLHGVFDDALKTERERWQ